ncbi:aquaglyceroporin, partial [Metarhizium majus ARSEF 297]
MATPSAAQNLGSDIFFNTSVPTLKLDVEDSIYHNDESTKGSNIEQLRWPRIRTIWQDGFSEFFGTMILVLFGLGATAQSALTKGAKGDYQSILWGWGQMFSTGVMLGSYVSGKSGGHINPAVTLASCVYRGHPWRKFPIYALAQTLGGIVAAAIVYGNYRVAIDEFEGGVGVRTVSGPNATADLFATYPAAVFISRTSMFFDEFLASSILQFIIFALSDEFNNFGAGPLKPLGLFFLVHGIGAGFGWQTGYAINLARDFGPRLVTYMAGYGPEVFSAGGYYFWVCTFARRRLPLLG